MEGVRVSLSSGDVFYVDGEIEDVGKRLYPREGHPRIVRVGSRYVNPAQVAQLTIERDIPSIHTPERLEVPA